MLTKNMFSFLFFNPKNVYHTNNKINQLTNNDN